MIREVTSSQAVRFPTGFVWGAAAAAHQIEGSTTADGRSDSIWDTFARVDGAIAGGDTGEHAVDHYRRMPSDVALMAEMGLPAYRFSIAWPRVRPGAGPPHQAGLDFYSRLVDELLEHGITPWATLYHWDLPQTLEDVGGWPVRSTAERFAEYASTIGEHLGDRVENWITLNEPWCSAFVGYAQGRHAPGRREPKAAAAAVHHLLLAHGMGVEALRAVVPSPNIGLTLNPTNFTASDAQSEADRDVARQLDGLRNRIFLDPVLQGEYPADVVADLEQFGLGDHIRDGDLAVISRPIDFVGVNYYEDYVVAADAVAPAESAQPGPSVYVGAEHARFVDNGLPRTAMDWEVRPDGLYDLLIRLHRDFPNTPIVITENGAAYDDVVASNGQVHDDQRIEYLDGHLRALHRALSEGVDVRGYFAWSWIDNFEWSEGYAKRFGLVYTDYESQRRTVKDSGQWYSSVISTNALP
jgi:beta-glucosidase